MSSMTGPAVFNDDSGRRAKVFQWGARGFVFLGLSLVTAVGLTLGTQVSLPGLDQLPRLDPIHRLVGSGQPGPVVPSAALPAPAVISDLAVSRVTTKASVAPPRPAASASPTEAATRARTSRRTRPASRPAPTASPLETTANPDSTTTTRPAVRGADRAAKTHGATKPRNPKAATPGSANAQEESASSTGKGKKPAKPKQSAAR